MPEPLATTKRKFHKLLDNLTRQANATVTAVSTSDLQTQSARDRLLAASERVSKRRRVDDQFSTPVRSSSAASSLRSLNRSTATARHIQPTASPSAAQTLPAFSPWSQEQFLKRLKTFSSVALWHLKPEQINEVVWAKRGWSCVAVNTVACIGGCEHRVVVDLTSTQSRQRVATDSAESDAIRAVGDGDEDEDTENKEDSLLEAFSQRYALEVVNGHDQKCLWRKAGCKDDIYRLQVVRPAMWKPQLSRRYASVLKIAASLEAVNLASSLADAASSELVEQLSDNGGVTAGALDLDLQIKAARVASHGWAGTRDSNADLLQCNACFQRVGLWMYQPGYHRKSTTPRQEVDESAENVDNDEDLDLLDMHREYCPWRNAKSQCASGSLAGLNASEILARVVSTYLREQKRTLNDITNQSEPPADALPEQDNDVPIKRSREEEDRLDQEREGRLQKLKRLLTLKYPRSIVVPR